MGFDQRVHGRTQQRLQRHQTQSPWLSLSHLFDYHALLHRRQTATSSVLTPYSTENSEEPCVATLIVDAQHCSGCCWFSDFISQSSLSPDSILFILSKR